MKKKKELSFERCIYCGLSEFHHVKPKHAWARKHKYQKNRRRL